ncbi:hypothetical protein C8R45DRAFT_384697 [Mycena sanguinolenta]|nr:hypothetical protein C8R45DRAFT_384697 [Mycena sanguinolenta]
MLCFHTIIATWLSLNPRPRAALIVPRSSPTHWNRCARFLFYFRNRPTTLYTSITPVLQCLQSLRLDAGLTFLLAALAINLSAFSVVLICARRGFDFNANCFVFLSRCRLSIDRVGCFAANWLLILKPATCPHAAKTDGLGLTRSKRRYTLNAKQFASLISTFLGGRFTKRICRTCFNMPRIPITPPSLGSSYGNRNLEGDFTFSMAPNLGEVALGADVECPGL